MFFGTKYHAKSQAQSERKAVRDHVKQARVAHQCARTAINDEFAAKTTLIRLAAASHEVR